METTNKRKRKTVDLRKSYNAKTRFVEREDGSVEQVTVMYDEKTGRQRRCIFETRHGKVQVTRGGLLIGFNFDRRRLDAAEMESYVYNETNEMTDFLASDCGERAVSKAAAELEKARASQKV